MQHNIPSPNPALGAWLLGPECLRIVNEVTGLGVQLYVDLVAIRTGRLAEAAHAQLNIGGIRRDRWVGDVVVDSPEIPYEASHEFGTERSEGVNDEGVEWVHEQQDAANDLNMVLQLLEHL